MPSNNLNPRAKWNENMTYIISRDVYYFIDELVTKAANLNLYGLRDAVGSGVGWSLDEEMELLQDRPQYHERART